MTWVSVLILMLFCLWDFLEYIQIVNNDKRVLFKFFWKVAVIFVTIVYYCFRIKVILYGTCPLDFCQTKVFYSHSSHSKWSQNYQCPHKTLKNTHPSSYVIMKPRFENNETTDRLLMFPACESLWVLFKSWMTPVC